MKNQICRNCLHFSAYYKRYGINFIRLSLGFCNKHDKQQASLETCENYQSNFKKEEKNDAVLLSSLWQAVESINLIAQIFKEKEN